MNAETVRILVASGFFMMLLFLRLEANRFGAAEYDEPGGRRGGPASRFSWYAVGFALLAAVYVVHPAPHDVLFLVLGPRTEVIVYGALLVVAGLAQAAGFAWLHYGYLRLPPTRAYPGAAANSIATAVIDEATFRGALLGSLLALGLPDVAAILMSAIVYGLVTRLAAPGHHPYPVVLALGMGLAFGWATLASGGLGAAIIGHAVTSFAVFVCTGHAGQVPRAGFEPEEIESRERAPQGWQDARRPSTPGRGAEPRGFAEAPAQSGFASRAGRSPETLGQGSGLMAWFRSSTQTVTHHAGRRAR
jgi:membrane protease YdiL (CAAX protease family)